MTSAPGAGDADVEVRRSARRRKTVTAFREQGRIVVVVPARMSRREERRWVAQMVTRLRAREERVRPPRDPSGLAERADRLATEYLAPALGEPPRPDRIDWVTNQNRRWASCTPATGHIRLSHRLQPMPAWVVDYVILHELAHLVEPGHGPRFWALVGRYPLTERARGYLDGVSDATGWAVTQEGPEPDRAGPGAG